MATQETQVFLQELLALLRQTKLSPNIPVSIIIKVVEVRNKGAKR